MNNIAVKILSHNLDGTPIFLAKMTQRRHEINTMDDLMKLYNDNIDSVPSERLLNLPHDTIQRMCYLTVAIQGLSTKAVSQLRTHATRLTFLSTSTQYSEFSEKKNPYVTPCGLNDEDTILYNNALEEIHLAYSKLSKLTNDRDTASYLLPQALKKTLIISGNLPSWIYVLKLRLCHRNTKEVQYIAKLIKDEIEKVCGKVYSDLCLPDCAKNGTSACKEGKFCCGKKYIDKEI